jgi:hypothetical protein
MTDQLQDVDLTCDALDVCYLYDFLLLQNLYRDFLLCVSVSPQTDFAEGTLA